MKTLFLTTGQGKSTSLLRCLRNTFADCHVEKGRLGSLNRIKAYPELTVVQVDYQTEPSDIEAMIPQLANLQDRFPQGSFVMFGIDRSQETPPSKTKASQEERFHAIFSCIRHYVAKFPNPDRVDIAFCDGGPEMAAKLSLIEAKMSVAQHHGSDLPEAKRKVNIPRPSPLDDVKEVIKATEDLRVESGRLSAEAIAKAFGVKLSELADWLGRSRQAVSKTPDADSLQNGLSFFERVARLRSVIPKDAFLKWLRMRNGQLDDKEPLELLGNGEGQVVADLVDDMLTGAPA